MIQDEIDRYKVEVEKKVKGELGKNDWLMIRGLVFNQYLNDDIEKIQMILLKFLGKRQEFSKL